MLIFITGIICMWTHKL